VKKHANALCHSCKTQYRWHKGHGEVKNARCVRCHVPLEGTPWGAEKAVREGYLSVWFVPNFGAP
jgi:hypothetical protein